MGLKVTFWLIANIKEIPWRSLISFRNQMSVSRNDCSWKFNYFCSFQVLKVCFIHLNRGSGDTNLWVSLLVIWVTGKDCLMVFYLHLELKLNLKILETLEEQKWLIRLMVSLFPEIFLPIKCVGLWLEVRIGKIEK